MSGAALDMTLDDLIKNNKKSGGGGGGGGRGRGCSSGHGPTHRFSNRSSNRSAPYSSSKAPDSAWTHDMFSSDLAMANQGQGGGSRPSSIETGTKLYISNLDYDDMFTEEQHELVESAAEMLYGLIHVRSVLTTKGQAAMLEKYKNAEFGKCPRVYCCGQPCLAVSQSDIPRQSTVKIFCPKCEDIYAPRSRSQNVQSYIPKVFGFKVHKP